MSKQETIRIEKKQTAQKSIRKPTSETPTSNMPELSKETTYIPYPPPRR